MTADALTEELRNSFRDGATVAKLIQIACDALGPEASRREYLKAVRDAFGLSVGGWYLPSYSESFGNGEARDSKLTWVFLGDILTRRNDWDTDAEIDHSRWFDGIAKSTDDELRIAVGSKHGLTAEGWALLGRQDRDEILRTRAGQISQAELNEALAALAEQLQRRVTVLENKLQPAEALVH